MKVYFSNYRDHWISPVKVIEFILRREIDTDNEKVKKWIDRLESVSVVIRKVLDKIHPKVDFVKIDYWDTWSMDHSLSHIVLPMLIQLKATKHGSVIVDQEDVPEHLRSDEDDGYGGKKGIHERWAWVLDEMIFAHQSKVDDSWEEQFYSGSLDTYFEPSTVDSNGKALTYEMKNGPKHTFKCDYEGMRIYQERISNGFRLFGKYYEGLWD